MNTAPDFDVSKELGGEESFGPSIDALPRAVLRPNAYLLLDGEWRFALDLEDRGLHELWHLGHPYTETGHWPGNVEEHMKGKEQQERVIGWYERDFPLPELTRDLPKSMVQLVFGACGYETQVWLNGFPLKTVEGELVHYGEYTSFSYELEWAVLQPVNRLTVRIEDTLDADIPRGKQESVIYKKGGIWYQAYSGPVRSIWLETIERNRLRSKVGVVSIVEDRLVQFSLTTHIHDPGCYNIELQVSSLKPDGAPLLAAGRFKLLLEAGEKQHLLTIDLPEAQLWAPESPQLYLLTAKLIDNENVSAVIETTFGLRKIEARGPKIYLNNEPLYLDGILYQPGASTYEEIKKHLYAIKKLGCNLVRIHIAGLDPRIYRLADRIGLLLWVEVPSPHRSSQISRANHRQELLRMLGLLETHPSIVIWSLYNESWGAQDLATNTEAQQYIIDLYDFMHTNHPQFLVVDNDGWNHVSYKGRLKSDILTAHVYTPDVGVWKQLLEKMVKGDMHSVTPQALVVGDSFFYRKQLPVIISEWGGFGFQEYGGPDNPIDKSDLILQFKKELRKWPIAGDVYTQAINVEEERNGLIEGNSGELLVQEKVLGSVADIRT